MSQQKITEGLKPSELPDLTPQQLKFVEGLLSGKTASDAYRQAYDCSNSSNKTIWVDASRLKNNPDVALWLEAARASGFGKAQCTLDEHLRELERLRGVCERSGNLGAAVNAEVSRGKAAGLYVDKVQQIPADTDPVEKLKDIERKHGTEVAVALHAKLAAAGTKLNWQPSETRH